MIAFKDNMPLLEFDGGFVFAFQRDWLLRSLTQAARKAGYQKWWLAEHVTESVATYLMYQEHNVVTVPGLAKSVQSILQVIGYAEVANHFVPGPPLLRISLFDLASAAGNGYELVFFDLLAHRIQEMMQMHSNYFELLDLELCVKHLRSKKIWSRDCDTLRSEIVAFVREQISASNAGREIVFSLS